MMKVKSLALALVTLMAAGAYAEDTAVQATTTVPKKVVTNKAKSKKKTAKTIKTSSLGPVASKIAARDGREGGDALMTSASSSTSTTNTTSLPGITAGTSTTTAPAAVEKKTWADGIRAAFGLEYYGPSVTEPFSSRMPGLDPSSANHGYAEGNGGVELLEHPQLGYNINDNVSITLDPYFETIGESLDDDGNAQGDGSSFRYREDFSYFAVRVKHIVKVGKFNYGGNFRFTPGFGDRNKELGRNLYFRHDMNLSYALTPKMNLAMYNTLRAYLISSDFYAANPNAYDWRFAPAPAVEYQLTDSFGGYLAYIAEIRHNHRTGRIFDAPPDVGPYVELGGSWDITKKINLNPYIDAYTNTPNIEAWQLGANLMVTIL